MRESSRQSSSLEARSQAGHSPTRGSSSRALCPETSQAEAADRAATTAISLHMCHMRQGLPLSNRPAQPLQAVHLDSSWSYTIVSPRRKNAAAAADTSLILTETTLWEKSK
ncbi:hypothetical protein RRG08_034771 [Elysia crispata]|uniref:Uncharacterized protein n=1 Tax=Elysia crispata TaxID=231223 RepID=A0AAE0YBT8_9GAST|nr:hypothetical protein RRG08_034771 [Elysia crispata]